MCIYPHMFPGWPIFAPFPFLPLAQSQVHDLEMIETEEEHRQSQPLAAASAEAALNIGMAAAGRTTEVLGLVLLREKGLIAVCHSSERKGLIAVSKTMNRMVRRAIVMRHAAFHRQYPDLRIVFVHSILNDGHQANVCLFPVALSQARVGGSQPSA